MVDMGTGWRKIMRLQSGRGGELKKQKLHKDQENVVIILVCNVHTYLSGDIAPPYLAQAIVAPLRVVALPSPPANGLLVPLLTLVDVDADAGRVLAEAVKAGAIVAWEGVGFFCKLFGKCIDFYQIWRETISMHGQEPATDQN